ncbi:MAG TPA: GntR family transcriptional regulator [Anaerolineales bacterium]|nr:GntR family transcriptional regulator [Anaerolineales bacterium]
MNIQLDFRSGEPIYTQIMEQIRQLVASGELRQGDQLPTVRQLAAELRVNFNTVARAYRLLDEAGLISTQQGRGTYIWEKPSEETILRLRQHGLESLTRRYLAEAAHLDYSPQEVAELIVRHIRAWQAQGSQYFQENKDL